MRESITLILSIWGAVLSSILFAIKLTKLNKDRAKIWIRARWGTRTTDYNGKTERGLSFRIVNRGRRIAYIREVLIRMRYKTDIQMDHQVGVSLGNDKIWLFDVFDGEPLKLTEGEQKHYSAWINLKDERCYSGAVAEVITTVGEKYKSKVIDTFENDNLGPDNFT